MSAQSKIPQPPTLPFIGNVAHLDRELPIQGFTLLAQQYGEIYLIDILGRKLIFLNTQELANEVSNDAAFRKGVVGSLNEVRYLSGDGLFTAYEDEPNWAIAHRLLLPAFNTMAIRDMMEDMRDICSQLLLKWERLNSFYTENQPAFAAAMTDFLKECYIRSTRPSFMQALMSGTTAKWESDAKFMTDVATRILNDRRENPIEKKDLLDTMLYSKDPKTGQGLSDDAIVKNLLTFLIAGHETSSGLMSFMTYYLIKNPETMRKLQAEVDEVLGGQPVQYQDLSKMPYLTAVIRETLRLAPTAPMRMVKSLEDTYLAKGKYFVKAGSSLIVNTWVYQKDPKVWGEDTGNSKHFRPSPGNQYVFSFSSMVDLMKIFGQPADNAARFVDWISTLQGSELRGVRYAVFGCGNSDWTQTYQRVPTLIDEKLQQSGGECLLPRGAGDSSKGDFFDIFDQFTRNLWATLTKVYSTVHSESLDSGFKVDIDSGANRPAALPPGHPVKRHIEFKLPEGSTYRAGDYLAIILLETFAEFLRISAFPMNKVYVRHLSHLDKPVSLTEVLSGYVELSQPATAQDLRTLIDATIDDAVRAQLVELQESYQKTVLSRRICVLDLLEKHPNGISLDLATYLRMLPPMRIRQYSISSSPLWNAEHVTLTVSVLEAESLSGEGKTFLGVASNYLSELVPGDRVQMSVRASAAAFRLPEDLEIPLLAYCAGSGLAPLRGFIQERALQKISGRKVGKILLFFGCRDPEGDYLYSTDDLAEWSKLGVVDIRPAFSRVPERSKGCKYIQDRLWADKEDVVAAFNDKAHIAKAVRKQSVEILRSLRPDLDQSQAVKELESVLKGRFATDVFD
ncbi:hypothetical protein HHX47_DHR3000960 [Lentinula edodes]|nr:hypothetical protein HHX47_DHR3000960 [Lentinula edodes]